MLTPEGRIKAQADYDKARAKLDAIRAKCGWCKRNPRGYCKKHNEESRLLYVTSPISETYWSS